MATSIASWQANVIARIAATELITGDMDQFISTFTEHAGPSFTYGTGTGYADLFWCDTRTINASSNETLDCTSLIDSLGLTISTMAKIKALYVQASAGNTNSVVVGAAASNPFVGPFGGTAITATLPPGAGLLGWDKPGWTCTGSTKNIKVANSSSGTAVTYKIAILGASA